MKKRFKPLVNLFTIMTVVGMFVLAFSQSLKADGEPCESCGWDNLPDACKLPSGCVLLPNGIQSAQYLQGGKDGDGCNGAYSSSFDYTCEPNNLKVCGIKKTFSTTDCTWEVGVDDPPYDEFEFGPSCWTHP